MNTVWNCIEDPNKLDFPTAIRALDKCVDAIPSLGSSPNVKLARLLLQQCDEGRAMSPVAAEDPSFLVLGNDELYYRVALLCRLGAEPVGEKLLCNLITQEGSAVGKKSELLMRRARVRALLGRFVEAQADAEQSITLAANRVLKAQRQSELLKISDEIPAYAAYFKTLPKK